MTPQSLSIADLKAEYEVVITHKGNGEWYHGYENPLEHRWIIVGNKATCSVCDQVIERRLIHPPTEPNKEERK